MRGRRARGPSGRERPPPTGRGVESDVPRRDEPHRPPHVPPGRGARRGLGREPWPPAREAAGRPPSAEAAGDRPDAASWARPASRSRCSTRGPSAAASLDRVLRLSFASGVRVFDTAKVYGTEPNFKKWFEQSPEVRKQIFLVTKDMPADAAADARRWSTSGWRPSGPTTSTSSSSTASATTTRSTTPINFVKSQEFKEAADAIRKSGKAKFIGFSTHHKDRAQIIQAAAEGGHRRRDHAPVHPLARQGLAPEQGPRRLPGRRGSA